MIDWPLLLMHIGPPVLASLGVIWKVGRHRGRNEAELEALWEWYKRTHNGHVTHEHPCCVCGQSYPVMICQKVPGTVDTYEWLCRQHWNERYGR